MGLLALAANGGHVEVVALALEQLGWRALEVADQSGYTPLLLAAWRGHVQVVQYLAAAGANMQARIKDGRDALDLAQDDAAMTAYLTHAWNFSPLQVACDARLLEATHTALAAGADPARGFPRPLDLCLALGSYPGTRSPCPHTTALVRLALRPWGPETHGLRGPQSRAEIMVVFLVRRLLERDEQLPQLPREVWLHIAAFVPRNPGEHAAIPASALDGRAARQTWRKLYLSGAAGVLGPEINLRSPNIGREATPLANTPSVAEDTESDLLGERLSTPSRAEMALRISWV